MSPHKQEHVRPPDKYSWLFMTPHLNFYGLERSVRAEGSKGQSRRSGREPGCLSVNSLSHSALSWTPHGLRLRRGPLHPQHRTVQTPSAPPTLSNHFLMSTISPSLSLVSFSSSNFQFASFPPFPFHALSLPPSRYAWGHACAEWWSAERSVLFIWLILLHLNSCISSSVGRQHVDICGRSLILLTSS